MNSSVLQSDLRSLPQIDGGRPESNQAFDGPTRRPASASEASRDDLVDNLTEVGRHRSERPDALWSTAAVSAMLQVAAVVAVGLLPTRIPPPPPQEQSIAVEILTELPAPPPKKAEPRTSPVDEPHQESPARPLGHAEPAPEGDGMVRRV